MNEKQQIFFIFVSKANLADSKFTCQRSNDTEAGSKSSNRLALVKPFQRKISAVSPSARTAMRQAYVAAALGLSLFSRVFESV